MSSDSDLEILNLEDEVPDDQGQENEGMASTNQGVALNQDTATKPERDDLKSKVDSSEELIARPAAVRCSWRQENEFKDKVEQLRGTFKKIPKVYIRRVLKREDIAGDIALATAVLSEFQDQDSSKGFLNKGGEKSQVNLDGTAEGASKKMVDSSSSNAAARNESVSTEGERMDSTESTSEDKEGSMTGKGEEEAKGAEGSGIERSGGGKEEGCASKSRKKSKAKRQQKVSQKGTVEGPEKEQEGGTKGKPDEADRREEGGKDLKTTGGGRTSRGSRGQDSGRGGAQTFRGDSGPPSRRGKGNSRGGRGKQWQNRGARGRGGGDQRGGGWHRGFSRGGNNWRGRGYYGDNQWDQWDQWDQWGYQAGPEFYGGYGGGAGAAWGQRGYPNQWRPSGMGSSSRGRGYGGGRGGGMHYAQSQEDLSWEAHHHGDHSASYVDRPCGYFQDGSAREAWPQQPNTDGRRGNPRGARSQRGRGQGNSTRGGGSQPPEPMPGGTATTVAGPEGTGVSTADAAAASELDSRFEPNKLLVKELSKETSQDGLQNYVEVVSGDEVVEIVFLGGGQALVTLQNAILDLERTKQKSQRRQLDSARVVLERVEVCSSILVKGFSGKTTKDALCLYFENTKRSAGGTVEKVDLKSGDKHAVVHFSDPKDAENVILREEKEPHVLNQEQLTVSKFYPFLKVDGEKQTPAASSTPQNAAEKDEVDRTDPEPSQSMHFAVDGDKMDFIMKSSHRVTLAQALSKHLSEFHWNPGNPTAVITHRGGGTDWQGECAKEMSSHLERFGKCDVPVKAEFSQVVCDQLPSITEKLGQFSLLLKPFEESKVLRVICLKSSMETFENNLKDCLEEVYTSEVRKTYSKKTESGIPEEKIVLLEKIKFAENLMQKHCDLEIVMDAEEGEISFEGPKEQFKEAMISYRKQINAMSSRILNLKPKIIEILGDKMAMVTEAFEKNGIEAVFVIGDETTEVVGTSAEQVRRASDLVSGLVVEEKVSVEDESRSLLQTREWRQFCSQMEEACQVKMRSNDWGDTWILGVVGNVKEVKENVEGFVEENTVRETQFSCASKATRRFLQEQRSDAIKKIKEDLKEFQVEIKQGASANDFAMKGTNEGLKQARRKLQSLTSEQNVYTTEFKIQQPGLRKYAMNGKAAQLMRGVERDNECVVEMRHRFTKIDDREADPRPMSPEEDDDSDDDVGYAPVTTDGQSAFTFGNCRISWKPGDITRERAEIIVSSEGACATAILNAAGQGMAQALVTPVAGDVTSTTGFNLHCNHVIHTKLVDYDGAGGRGEQSLRQTVRKSLGEGVRLQGKSIAFPVIGAGKRGFPANEASRIMLEECVQFLQANPNSSIADVRFVVYANDQTLVAAFKQEMAAVLARYGSTPPPTSPTRSVLGTNVKVQVMPGDITQQNTDAIVNISGPDLDMNKAGALSKAVALASGAAVETECRNTGRQTAGAAVMTSGGNLTVPHIIHSAPGSGNKQHLQQCVENALSLADNNRLQSVSLPAFGTGGFGLSAQDSAELTFQALVNFSPTSQTLRQVNIVIFQAPMVQAFTQEQQKRQGGSTRAKPTPPPRPQAARPKGVVTSAGAAGGATFIVLAKDEYKGKRAVTALEKGLSDACMTKTVTDKAVQKLTDRQIDKLKSRARRLDVEMKLDQTADTVTLRGDPKDVVEFVEEVWKELNASKEKERQKEHVTLVAKNVQWYYRTGGGADVPFDKKTNAELEKARAKDERNVTVSLPGGEKYVIDVTKNAGVGVTSAGQIAVSRSVIGSSGGSGIALPREWAPMPRNPRTGTEETFFLVALSSSSPEYQQVLQKMQATAGNVHVSSIKRVQNPTSYQTYMTKKQNMDKTNAGRNNERELFHGTATQSVDKINAQGFNRSFSGRAHGAALGNGVYFARDASYSIRYAFGGAGVRQMFLARVLVGEYTKGNSGMIVPPPKNPSRPEIIYDSVVDNPSNPSVFVVFNDTQCYPKYLITF